MYFLLSLGSEGQPKYLYVRMAIKHLEWEGVAEEEEGGGLFLFSIYHSSE